MRYLLVALAAAAIVAPVSFGLGLSLQVEAERAVQVRHDSLDAVLRTHCASAVLTGERWMVRAITIEEAINRPLPPVELLPQPLRDYVRAMRGE